MVYDLKQRTHEIYYYYYYYYHSYYYYTAIIIIIIIIIIISYDMSEGQLMKIQLSALSVFLLWSLYMLCIFCA